jgi:hypothetical protein
VRQPGARKGTPHQGALARRRAQAITYLRGTGARNTHCTSRLEFFECGCRIVKPEKQAVYANKSHVCLKHAGVLGAGL